eukprot:Gb_26218 [translate_table: standard]
MEMHNDANDIVMQQKEFLVESDPILVVPNETTNSDLDESFTLRHTVDHRTQLSEETQDILPEVNENDENCGQQLDQFGLPDEFDAKSQLDEDSEHKGDPLALFEEVRDDVKDLCSENQVLQKRLLSLQKRRSTIGTKLFFEGIEGRYQDCLREWAEIKEELHRLKDEYDDKIDKFQEQVRQKQEQTKELQHEFSDFKWQLQFEDEEEDEEIEMLKIEARQLTNRSKKIQQALEKKDILPDGLTAYAFEQLKVENESLHRQLAKRNLEIAELNKRTSKIVHALSHVREKLQSVKEKTKADSILVDAETLENVNSELNERHSALQKMKAECGSLNDRRARMQKYTVKIENPTLLHNLESCQHEIEDATKMLEGVKKKHAILIQRIKDLRNVTGDASTQ